MTKRRAPEPVSGSGKTKKPQATSTEKLRKLLASAGVGAGLGAAVIAIGTGAATDGYNALKNWIAPGPDVGFVAQYDDDICSTWIVPKSSVDDGEPAPADSDFARWAKDNDGVQVGQTVLITITGYKDRPVTLTRMRIVGVKQDQAPAPGVVVARQCGDPITARYAEIDLDSKPPRVLDSSTNEAPESGELRKEPLVFPYTVTGSNTESLLLITQTSGYAEWRVELSWSNGVKQDTLVIDDNGQPFKTTYAPPEGAIFLPDGEYGWAEI